MSELVMLVGSVVVLASVLTFVFKVESPAPFESKLSMVLGNY